MSVEIFNENRQIFLDRFPEAFFFLSELEKGSYSHLAKNWTEQKMQEWASSKDLAKIDLLYVYGTGLGLPYLAFKNWLEEKKERQIVFLEENPSHMGSFLATPLAKECLTHPRVHFFLYEAQRRAEVLDEAAGKFPMARIDLVASPPYKKEDLFEIKLQLFRKTTLSEAFLSDTLFSHRHFSNFIPNVRKIASSSLINQMKGKFTQIPAIICGAGSSLQDALEFLPEIQHKALIIAGGSAIAALSSQGVLPHLGMAFDPNFEEYLRMKASFAFETPFFFAMRLFHPAFSTFNGPLGYMRSAIGGLEELWMDEKLSIQKEGFIGEKLSQEALSVTTIAIALARFLGSDPIILTGVDLSYRNQKRYAQGVVLDNRAMIEEIEEKKNVSDRIFERKNQKGEKIYTSTKWLMESATISSYAKEFPKTRFFNASLDGLPIEGIPFINWKDLLEKELTQSLDISAFLHTQLSQTRFSSETSKKMDRFCKRLQKSFERCEQLTQKILEEMEKGKNSSSSMILAEMDLKEEDAFLYFLSAMPLAIDRVLERKYPGSQKDPTSQLSFQRLKEKWQRMHLAVKDHVAVFSQSLRLVGK